MTGTLFERTLATADIEAAFADAQVIVAMLAFEAALADAEADEGLIPRQAAAAAGRPPRTRADHTRHADRNSRPSTPRADTSRPVHGR